MYTSNMAPSSLCLGLSTKKECVKVFRSSHPCCTISKATAVEGDVHVLAAIANLIITSTSTVGYM